MTERFEAYCRRKESAAMAAAIPGYSTVEQHVPPGTDSIGTPWTRSLFDGPFFRSTVAAHPDIPVTNLVFVQSKDGNTVAADPSTLGGGATDLHLIYEGLTRVDADAVIAGAATARARDIVFSVWHPDLVSLRLARGRSRHPAQVVVTSRGNLRIDEGLMFLEPELRVFVVTGSAAASGIRRRVAGRPWIDVLDTGEPLSVARGVRDLHARGIRVVSCVGGRVTATALLREGLVSDLYLTTAATEGGQPGTPFYDGPPLRCERIVLKAGRGPEDGVRFEHFAITSSRPS